MTYQQITIFYELVNKSRIYDEDSRKSAAHYKSLHDKKGKGKFRGKSYYGKKKDGDGKKTSGEDLTLLSSASYVVLRDIVLPSVLRAM